MKDYEQFLTLLETLIKSQENNEDLEVTQDQWERIKDYSAILAE